MSFVIIKVRRERCLVFFFFQAEDGIRDYKVTGVQTCALPIWSAIGSGMEGPPVRADIPDSAAPMLAIDFLPAVKFGVAEDWGHVACVIRSIDPRSQFEGAHTKLPCLRVARTALPKLFFDFALLQLQISAPVLLVDIREGRI